jgi:hypothetical protein
VNKLLPVMLSVLILVVACSKKTPTSPDVPPAQTACTYSVSTTIFNIAGTGGTATVAVTTGSTCAWTVANSSPFVTITSPASQTGPGNVSFAVTENPGDARVATFVVAGQTITVNQSASDPVFGNWGGTIVKGTGCPATLPAAVEYTGTIRRTSGATNEFLISIPSVGVNNLAIPLTINGSSLQFAVPIDTLYTFNATLSSDRRSLTGTFSGGTCNGTWTGNRR